MRYPRWKELLIIAIVVVSVIYSLPNLYPDQPAVQITGSSAGVQVSDGAVQQAMAAISATGVAAQPAERQANGILIRLHTSEDQLRAQDAIRRALGDSYVVALNLAPTTPSWLKMLHADPMKLGLDLRGGVHFLLEVDLDKAVSVRMESYIEDIKGKLREAKVSYRGVVQADQSLMVKFDAPADRDQGSVVLHTEFPEFIQSNLDKDGSYFVTLSLAPARLHEITDDALNQNLNTIRSRVNELGVAEAVVQRQGANRIVVELPGVQDTAEAKRVLGRTATLEFRFVDWEHENADPNAPPPPGTEWFPFKDNARPPVLLQKHAIVTGNRVSGAHAGFDEYSRPQVDITLDGRGGRLMTDATRNNLYRSMAVLFVEQKMRTLYQKDAQGKDVEIRQPYTEKQVINVATVQSVLGSQFRITGLDSPAEAAELALLLRAGALAAPMYFVEERTVGPSLGQENIDKGVRSTILGLVLVVIFMIANYRIFGVTSVLAMLLNLAILMSLMGAFGAALSLPGIAGIVLSVGMSVDANVLIFERIREEVDVGLSPHAAIIAGYDRAFTTILDSNLSILIVASILIAMGAGPVKGFAVTLAIGIIASMFTAITVTRALINRIYGGRRVARLSI
ncbi:MAG: protein translocase subunit SecD [Pseudomonadales bacterium]|nr:protein translocase subunit SecD [Pseudomonadales bacterium]